MTYRRLFPLLLLLATPAAAEPGVVEVTINGVHSAAGHVLVAICDKASFTQPVCPYHGSVPSAVGSVVVRITGVPPGVYAAQAYQDENDDRTINRNFIGMPTEGMGFSNDAKMRFGPPSFDDAAFSLTAAGGAIHFSLRYF
jgi:uncharacterized protein (DUF2141 family)